MNQNLLKGHVLLAKRKTDQYIHAIPQDQWHETPDVINSNMNWQIGHIILANYLHGIASITGANATFRDLVNVSDFVKFYGPNSNPSDFLNEKPSSEVLIEAYELTMRLLIDNVETLKETEWDKPTEVPNPAVKTKLEALLWLPQHQSWHNGQIAVLKRVLEQR